MLLAPPMLAVWLLILLFLVSKVSAAEEPQYVIGTIDGKRYRVRDDRPPALYTADYGDCLGESLINVTRFDAAYYRDNMTILFHLEGETALRNESIMMSIGVFAYGESRFELTFDPCRGNIHSACPVLAGIHIEAAGYIPVSPSDVAGIPDLALTIPDFEGQAILRIFSNSTEAEIGCFAAQITNGHSFRQQTELGLILGVFTLVAILASFATTIYGDDIVEMRKHYAHSLSVMVVFAVWHHIYFSGALSMNWPKVLSSFWSNYAWSGGMIYSEHMQNSINSFIGSNKGNTSHVGAAGTGVSNPGLGGGYDIHAIYRRELVDPISGFSFNGRPVKPGLPLPGNHSGFAGTLAQEGIPASNAFMTCLLWLLTLVALLVASIVAFKLLLEVLTKTRLMNKDRLLFFRAHYARYTVFTVLRTALIGFFMIAFVSMFQFSYLKSSKAVAIACVIFLIVVFGIGSAAGLACYWKVSGGKYVCYAETLNIERIRVCKFLPWYRCSRQSQFPRSEDMVYAGSIPWWKIRASSEEKISLDHDSFIKRFGWLASRYRKSRWWFFAIWLVYEFTRACILAGASSQPLTQVFGLLTLEVIAFIAIVYLRPFEGQRLNILLVYLLGFSKVTTTALSAAFDRRFNLPRISAAVIGIIIIVIQGLLTACVLFAIIFGTITSYFSLTRKQKEIRPRCWISARDKYLERINFQGDRIDDILTKRSVRTVSVPEAPKGPYFSVNQVKRIPKVEDEDDEFMREINSDPSVSPRLTARNKLSGGEVRSMNRLRAASNQSQVSISALPRAARLHRPSWASYDFVTAQDMVQARTVSDTMSSTPRISKRPAGGAMPRSNGGVRSSEVVDRKPGPTSINEVRASTPYLMSQLSQNADRTSTSRQPAGVLNVPLRSSSISVSPIEVTIGENERPISANNSSVMPSRGFKEAE